MHFFLFLHWNSQSDFGVGVVEAVVVTRTFGFEGVVGERLGLTVAFSDCAMTCAASRQRNGAKSLGR